MPVIRGVFWPVGRNEPGACRKRVRRHVEEALQQVRACSLMGAGGYAPWQTKVQCCVGGRIDTDHDCGKNWPFMARIHGHARKPVDMAPVIFLHYRPMVWFLLHKGYENR